MKSPHLNCKCSLNIWKSNAADGGDIALTCSSTGASIYPYTVCFWSSITRSNRGKVDHLLSLAIDLLKIQNLRILSLFIVDANLFFQVCHLPQRDAGDGVLWYIYSCQSLTSWDSDKIKLLRRRILPLAVSRSTYSSHASHPILFDTSQVNTSCQSALKSHSHIYRKSCASVIREQRPTTPVNSTAVQKVWLGSVQVLL